MLKFMLKNKLTVGLMTLLIFVVGIYAFTKLDKELFPSMEFDQTIVMVETEEMPAEDVEQFVTVPIEQIIENLDAVTDYESSSTNGATTIFVDMESGKGKGVTEELNNQINQLQADLFGVKDIFVQQISTSNQYEFFLDITGENLSEISQFATDVVKPRLEALPEVNEVSLTGVEEKEISITLLTDKLSKYELSTQDIMQSMDQINTNMALGTLEKEAGNPAIRWNTSLTNLDDIKNVPLQTNQGMIHLKDVAKIEEKLQDTKEFAWKNGNADFIGIQISRANGFTQIDMAEAVRDEIKEMNQTIAGQMEINEIVAQADYVSSAIEGVTDNIIIGSIIAFIVLILFLRNVRATLIVGLTIPASLLLTIITMVFLDYSFNLISLIALGLGIGMMVDASVVVLESIFKKKEMGLSNLDAVITGTKEVFGAVMASMLTTIVVFVPISIMQDDIGKMMVILTVVVAITLISSVIVAFTIIPAISENFLKLRKPKIRKKSRIIEGYGNIIEWMTKKKRRRVGIIGLFTAVFISSFFLISNIPMTVMPDILNRYAEVMIELEPGVSTDERTEIAMSVNNELQKVEDVADNIVLDNNDFLYAIIQMTPEEEKTREQNEVNEEILERLSTLEKDYPISAVGSTMDGTVSPPIQLIISGEELEQLEKIAAQTSEKLATIEGIDSTKIQMGETTEEYVFQFDEKKMEEDGVTQPYLYAYISQLFFEAPAGELLIDRVAVPMKIKNDLSIQEKNDVLKEKIPTFNGEKQLSHYVSFEKQTSLGEIKRANGERYISIVADYTGQDLGNINLKVQEMVKNLQVTNGYTVAISGDLEEQQQMMQDLMIVLIISIFLVFMVMAIQFNSLKHPIIILFIIPFTITGVLIGLFLTQNDLNIMSGIGVIMLVGIVLNNGILLIDRIKQLRNQGLDVYQAVIAAGKDRIRPIFITTFMTVGGMIPLAFATGSSSGYQSPLAVVIISGLLYSTLISLVLIPSIYLVFEDVGALVSRVFRRKKKVAINRVDRKVHA